MTETMKDRLRLTAEDLNVVRDNLDWQAMFAGLGLHKAEKKSKADDWWAFSPFHEEQTPSFHMSAGGRWYDFSIGEGGGCIELIQRLQGVNCFEAGIYIVEQGWSWLPERPKAAQKASKPAKGRKTAAKTKAAVSASLKASEPLGSEDSEANTADAGENAPIRQDLMPMCTYHEALESRGISEETAEMLGIGYLSQGRSVLRGRIVFQVRDARLDKDDALSRKRVILSHMGRAVKEGQEPKYLLYEGFHKSQEILGQDRLWLDPLAIEQIKATGCLVITEGPFDWAKAVEAEVHNIGATFGASLSEAQAHKIKALASHHGICAIRLAYDRDEAGQQGAAKAKELLNALDLDVDTFKWDRVIGRIDGKPTGIPEDIGDLAEFSVEQLRWLRGKGWL